jgi:hypothetical protein
MRIQTSLENDIIIRKKLATLVGVAGAMAENAYGLRNQILVKRLTQIH